MGNNYYTGKGDRGDTGLFGSAERFPKSSLRYEALGTVDEANSWLGLCKTKQSDPELKKILEWVQQRLFTIQAELGGSDIHLEESHVKTLEAHIAKISETLPVIKTFVLPGASEFAAHFDIARTVVRTAERRIVALSHDQQMMGAVQGRPREFTLAFMNRLSSLLYVLARQEAMKSGEAEKTPSYQYTE